MKTRTKNRSCTGKQPYSTKAIAEGVMWKLIRAHRAVRRTIHVYRCTFGDHWHIGHR